MKASQTSLPLLDRAVFVTVAYTDQFSYPLTHTEVLQRCLITETKRALSSTEIDQALHRLVQARLLESSVANEETYFYLPGRKESVAARQRAEVAAADKHQEIQTLLTFLQRIPSIMAVYITGSQAMKSATPQTDIDFMIITQPNRLWLTRVLVSFFAQLHGKRRSWNKEEPGSWCFNLWLDTEHLQVHPSKQDSYRAYEVLQAKVLFDRDHVAERFLQDNEWVGAFLNACAGGIHSTAQHPHQKKSSIFDNVLSGIDWVSWRIQEAYMSRHRTTEKVGRGYAFFHPRDTGHMIQKGWLHSLERCLSKETAAEILQPYVRSRASD